MSQTPSTSSTKPLTETIVEVIGSSNRTLSTTMQRMDTAADALDTHDENGFPQGALSCLFPTPLFDGIHSVIYKAHCAELLDRIAGNDHVPESVMEPTRTEILIALSETSLKAPFNHAGTVAIMRLFREVMGDTILPGVPVGQYADSPHVTDREVNEIIEAARRMVRPMTEAHRSPALIESRLEDVNE